MYYLYAMERVGRLTGQRFIGGIDWYRAGADYLLKIQDESGKIEQVPASRNPSAPPWHYSFLRKENAKSLLATWNMVTE